MNVKPFVPFILGFVLMTAFGWGGFPLFLYKSADQPVQFNHSVHTTGAGMSCQDCHALRANGTFSGIPTVEQCKTCHSETIGSSNAERILVESYVKQNREIPWNSYSRQPDNAYFSHVFHLKNGNLDCQSCHGDHGSSEGLRPTEFNRVSGYARGFRYSPSRSWNLLTTDGMKMDECIECHRSQHRRLACIDCHK